MALQSMNVLGIIRRLSIKVALRFIIPMVFVASQIRLQRRLRLQRRPMIVLQAIVVGAKSLNMKRALVAHAAAELQTIAFFPLLTAAI